jgi:glycosyltransferase involved in cell wall biosynthesis
MSISVLILTRNEERDLPGCLRSVAWCDDIHVYDSLSTDATVDIAQAFGAAVAVRPGQQQGQLFGGGEAEHRNWGLRNIRFKYPWVLQLDADERVTPELAAQLQRLAAAPGDAVAYRIRRRDFFMGRWLKHVQTSPFYIRFFKPSCVSYQRLINPVSVVDGPVAETSGYLDHFPFSKGMEHWLSRHNAYSTLEAKQIMANRQDGGGEFRFAKAFLARDFNERRYHQKELFYRLPARPLLKFLILYVGKRGFLDGSAGFTYACLQSIYEYFICLKTRELSARQNTNGND